MKATKTLKNLFYTIQPIWKVSPMYVIINVLYTFENIPHRLINVLTVKYIVDAAVDGAKFINIIYIGLVLLAIEIILTVAYFGRIRTLIPATSGQHFGIIRTA